MHSITLINLMHLIQRLCTLKNSLDPFHHDDYKLTSSSHFIFTKPSLQTPSLYLADQLTCFFRWSVTSWSWSPDCRKGGKMVIQTVVWSFVIVTNWISSTLTIRFLPVFELMKKTLGNKMRMGKIILHLLVLVYKKRMFMNGNHLSREFN